MDILQYDTWHTEWSYQTSAKKCWEFRHDFDFSHFEQARRCWMTRWVCSGKEQGGGTETVRVLVRSLSVLPCPSTTIFICMHVMFIFHYSKQAQIGKGNYISLLFSSILNKYKYKLTNYTLFSRVDKIILFVVIDDS